MAAVAWSRDARGRLKRVQDLDFGVEPTVRGSKRRKRGAHAGVVPEQPAWQFAQHFAERAGLAILGNILSLIGHPREIVQASMTCRVMQAASQRSFVWHHVDFTHVSPVHAFALVQFLVRRQAAPKFFKICIGPWEKPLLAVFLKQLRLHALTTVALEVRGGSLLAFEPPFDKRSAILIDRHGVHDTYTVECQRWLQASCLALSSSTNSLPDSSHVLSELVQRAPNVTSLSLNGGCLQRSFHNDMSALKLQDTELILRLTQLQKLSISAECIGDNSRGFGGGAPEVLTQLVSSLPHLSELYFRSLCCRTLRPLNLAQSSLRVLHVSGKGWDFDAFPSTLQLFDAVDIYCFDEDRWQTILLRDAPACKYRRYNSARVWSESLS
jgi:hypothetical protein